jgi:hypothetical protein
MWVAVSMITSEKLPEDPRVMAIPLRIVGASESGELFHWTVQAVPFDV